MKEEVEDGRRQDNPLRDARANDVLECCRREILTGGSAATDIAGKASNQVRVESTIAEF